MNNMETPCAGSSSNKNMEPHNTACRFVDCNCILRSVVCTVLVIVSIALIIHGLAILFIAIHLGIPDYYSALADEPIPNVKVFSEVTGVFSVVIGGIVMLAVMWPNFLLRALYETVVVVTMGLLIIFAIIDSQTTRNQDLKTFASSLKRELKDYKGFEGKNKISERWNKYHYWFDCCGVDGYEDFHNLTYWPPNDTLKLLTPISCCKKINTSDITCAQNGTAVKENNWLEKGCAPYLYNLALPFPFSWAIALSVIIFVGIGMLVIVDPESKFQTTINDAAINNMESYGLYPMVF